MRTSGGIAQQAGLSPPLLTQQAHVHNGWAGLPYRRHDPSLFLGRLSERLPRR